MTDTGTRHTYKRAIAFGTASCALFLAWLAWRYCHPASITLDSGQQVRDVPVSEAGAFAGERFVGVRRAYLSNLETYRALKMEPVDPDVPRVSPRIRELLIAQLRADRRNQAALSKLDQRAIDDLGLRVAIVLARAAGMQLEAYRKVLDGTERLEIPPNLPPSDRPGDGSPEGTDRLFESLYRSTLASGSAPERITGWASVPDGFKVATGDVPPGTAAIDAGVLFDRLGEAERNLFRGMLAKGSLMFHVTPDAAKGKSGILFEASMVVEDGQGDRYPLWITLYHELGGQRWWPVQVYRTVSVRAANAPQLVF